VQSTTPIAQDPGAPDARVSFDRVNRRSHLYLGLLFLPWFLVYGVSSLVFSHPAWFNAGPSTKVLFDREYRLDPIAPEADLRPIGDRIQRDSGLEGHFVVFRAPDGQIRMYCATFLQATQISYHPERHRLVAEQSEFRATGLLTRLHTRGGFERPGFLSPAWSVIVDVVQLSIILWIISGLYIWWKLRRHRAWGLVALGTGFALFGWFLIGL
jgi:hypothetical protein